MKYAERQKKFWVRYEIEGFEKEGGFEAGPYDDREEALKQSQDIGGYEGVKNVSIEARQDPEDQPCLEVPSTLVCTECGFTQDTAERTGLWYSSGLFTRKDGMNFLSLHFQCCPDHAKKADGEYAPVQLDGFECWEDETPKSDHAVVEEAVIEEGDIPKPTFLNKSLDEAIKTALDTHKARPLKWDKYADADTERAWSEDLGRYITRPYIPSERREAIKRSARDLADALRASGDAPRKALEDFEVSMMASMLRPMVASAIFESDTVSQIHACVLNKIEDYLGSKGYGAFPETLSVELEDNGVLKVDVCIMSASGRKESIRLDFVHDVSGEETLGSWRLDSEEASSVGSIMSEIFDEELKEPLEKVKNAPLKWERFNETTERAWSPTLNKYIARPYVEKLEEPDTALPKLENPGALPEDVERLVEEVEKAPQQIHEFRVVLPDTVTSPEQVEVAFVRDGVSVPLGNARVRRENDLWVIDLRACEFPDGEFEIGVEAEGVPFSFPITVRDYGKVYAKHPW